MQPPRAWHPGAPYPRRPSASRSPPVTRTAAVSVELLTYADLEMLRERMGSRRPPSAVSATPAAVQNKRYLILTYVSDFDRVHYPLPLLYDADPDPARLRSTIQRLRAELASARSQRGTALGAHSRVGEIAMEVRRLREENKTLRAQLRRAEEETGAERDAATSRAREEVEVLAKELRALQRERDLLRREG